MGKALIAALLFAASALAQFTPPNGGGGGSGTVTSVTCGTNLTGGTITTSGTCALSNSPAITGSFSTGSGSGNTGGLDLYVGTAANLNGGNPATGYVTLFADSAGNVANDISVINSSGTKVDLQNPVNLQNFPIYPGSSPANVAIGPDAIDGIWFGYKYGGGASFVANGVDILTFNASNTVGVDMNGSYGIGWTTPGTGADAGPTNTALCVVADGELELGAHGAGTCNSGGQLILAGIYSGGTKFTISGCSAGTTVGGATAGSFLSGTTGTCTVVVTMNGATGLTAPNGWSCSASDLTTPANKLSQSASSATTCTITGTTVSGDKVQFMAVGF